MIKSVAILGSTGSIGQSTLDVVDRHPDRFRVVSLACGHDVDTLADQITRYNPSVVSVATEAGAEKLRKKIGDRTKICVGVDGHVEVATHPDVEMVVSAIVGAAGLIPTVAAIEAGKSIALANKETLVAGGPVVMEKVRRHKTVLLPVDSEHSAIFQCMQGESQKAFRSIILTASGGPFLNRPLNELETVSIGEALNHPNWKMGSKITVDSATMMNKGLELIEACWLFDVGPEKINVVIHPQSIIHSMVEYTDGSVLAQMSNPDMRGPIAYAMGYPDRIETGIPPLQLAKLQSLTFVEPDERRFPSLTVARLAIETGGNMPAIMNAANEIAVGGFLEGKIKFTDIVSVVKRTMQAFERSDLKTIDDVMGYDREARRVAKEFI